MIGARLDADAREIAPRGHPLGCVRGLVVIAIYVLGVGLAAPAAAQLEHALGPEAGDRIGALLGQAALPPGCEWRGADVEPHRVRSRYACGTDAHELVLVHPERAPEGAPRTAQFAGSASDPPELVAAVLSALRPLDASSPWMRVARPTSVSGSPAARTIPWSSWLFVALAVASMALGGLLVGRRRRDAPRIDDAADRALVPLVISLAAGWLAMLVVMIGTFRFVSDDFLYLVSGLRQPWSPDPDLRVLSVRVPFFLAAHGGGAPVMIALNVTAYASALALVAALARRLGAGRMASGVAALVVGLSPGFFDLVRYGAGFQQLAALALVLGALLAFDGAASVEGRARIGLVLLGVGLAWTLMLTKLHLAPALLLAGWIWSLRSARSWRAIAARSGAFGALAALMLLPLLTAGVELGEGRAGLDRLGENLGIVARGAAALLLRCGAVLALVVLAHRLVAPGSFADLSARASREPRSAARLAGWLLGLSLALTTPFVLNPRYFKTYYLVFATLWLAVGCARAITAAWSPSLGRVGGPLALAASVLLLPIDAARSALSPEPRNDVGPWLDEARRALEGVPRDTGVRIEPRCPREADTRTSRALARVYFEASAQGEGLRFVAGLDPGARITLEGGDAAGTLVYCESARPRLRWERATP